MIRIIRDLLKYDGRFRLAFVFLELVRRGKRLSPRREWLIHTVGFFLLIAAFLAVTFQDVARIISSGEGLP